MYVMKNRSLENWNKYTSQTSPNKSKEEYGMHCVSQLITLISFSIPVIDISYMLKRKTTQQAHTERSGQRISCIYDKIYKKIDIRGICKNKRKVNKLRVLNQVE